MRNKVLYNSRSVILNKKGIFGTLAILLYLLVGTNPWVNAAIMPDPYNTSSVKSIVTDTIPLIDRQGDFITDRKNNPFDITPSLVTQTIEYDAATDRYYIVEKIGDEYYRSPTFMTFDEYLEYKSKQQEKEYFQNLAGVQSSKRRTLNGKVDPMDKIDIGKSLVDRLFGGTEVDIKPQGSVDLTLGLFDYRKTTSGVSLGVQPKQLFIPGDFNIVPRLSVNGKIGTKMNLDFNYDTQSTFNFDQKLKLNYDTEQFSEDDIIKKIEAGDVSLPLKGNLIQGAQALFGLKTELQFGHLRVAALMSQQRSKQNNLKIENGASIQEFEITPEEYDENRHFFISHYNRETYEKSLSHLPQIITPFRLTQIEVWISDDRLNYNTSNNQQQQSQIMVAAISDIAEGDVSKYSSQFTPAPAVPMPNYLQDMQGKVLPDNRVNPLFEELANDPDAKDLSKTSTVLASKYNYREGTDFETFRGKKLNSSEYDYNPQLGTISLNIRLRPNQKLGIAYKYYFTSKCDSVFTVGQMVNEGLEPATNRETNEPEPSRVVFVKLLKTSTQSVTQPSWDLMMKNVYNLRTSQLNKEGFEFDIFFEDDQHDGSLKKYINVDSLPELRKKPLLSIYNLDNLNRFGDPQADGVFDYVPGVTVNERAGSIIFPVLEPFGSSLDSLLKGYPKLIDTFKMQTLYDSTLTVAKQDLARNKFLMKGKVKSENSGEINLGPFVPQGSVRVRAGGVELFEGSDYEIDYALGRLRILNPAYLNQSNINVSFEDNTAFSLQQKSMMGLRFDYDFSKKLTMGATYLKLSERPFTPKVNLGDEPIKNRIFGFDMNYSDEAPFLTTLADKLPFYSTKVPSTVTFSAEAAYLLPGHASSIETTDPDGTNPEAVVSIDDFEGAISGFSLGGFNINSWVLSSTPKEFREHDISDSLVYGANRARLNWYQLDQSSRKGDTGSSGITDYTDSYTRPISQTELFKRPSNIGQNELYTFDLSYYPNERGPYNFDLPKGYPQYTAGLDYDAVKMKYNLKSPKSRWGGIMRYFQNTDFESSNYAAIEFWVLNPFMERRDSIKSPEGESGEMVFNLGNVSEDILRDNLQFFENGLPANANDNKPVTPTAWGNVPIIRPLTNNFDITDGQNQDLGYDGLDDEAERVKFRAYLDSLGTKDPSINLDPSNDNFEYYNSPNLEKTPNLIERLKNYNNPQGNTPFDSQTNGEIIRGNRIAESEDLNNDRSLNQGENYHEYRIKFKNKNGELDTTDSEVLNYYKQTRIIINPTTKKEEKWYRIQVPLSSPSQSFDITGFRSIQFMRLYMTKFETAKTFRMADFQLVRNTWRKSTYNRCGVDGTAFPFAVDEVGVQENSDKKPFNYKTPSGIKAEKLPSYNGVTQTQDENSLTMVVKNLPAGCEIAINKLSKFDLNLYKKLQLFTHIEEKENELVPDDSLAVFVKLGKDLTSNYYEYEMPIKISRLPGESDRHVIWPDENFVNIVLSKFIDLKKEKLSSSIDTSFLEMADPDRPDAKLRMIGLPSLGYIKVVEIGVRNISNSSHSFEVWVNELRAKGLDEHGGYAAQAKLQVKVADFADFNFSTLYNSTGFGSLDKRLLEREQKENFQFDAATTMQLGKILPNFLPVTIPFFAQYSKQITNPRFDPYQRDLEVRDAVAIEGDAAKQRSQESTTIKSYSFTNVKKDVSKSSASKSTGLNKSNPGGSVKPSGSSLKPWSLENISGTYAWSETTKKDPIIESDITTETKMAVDYTYSTKAHFFKPLKFIKAKSLKIISEFNFNPIPNSFGFSTTINRYKNEKTFRLPDVPVYRYDDQRFKWDRNYLLDWDFTNSLRFNFRSNVTAVVDELRQVGIADNPDDRNWVDENNNDVTSEVNANPRYVDEYRNNNLKKLGRRKNYNHQAGLSYRLPFNLVPILDWVSSTADLKSDYSWTAGSLLLYPSDGKSIGNVIQNKQNRGINATFSFDKLYGKSSYLKSIDQGNQKSKAKTRTSRDTKKDSKDTDTKTDDTASDTAAQDGKKDREKKSSGPSKLERILIRPLLSLRSVKLTFKEDLGTTIPGFEPDASILGLSDGFKNPGWAFVSGFQPNLDKKDPNNWLRSNYNADPEIFNKSVDFNDQILQSKRHNISAKIILEPFKDFDIDLDFSKDYRQEHTEIFKYKEDKADFMQTSMNDVGSYEFTYSGLSTLFQSSEDLFAQFQKNTILVSQRIGINEHEKAPSYTEGFGPLSNRVLVPSLLSAYTNQDYKTVPYNLNTAVQSYGFMPKPNWTIRYDGLSKLPIFKDLLTSFTLKHGYKSTINVSSYYTDLSYNDNNPSQLKINGDYYSQLIIPSLSMNQQFTPLIGVSMKTKNDMSINFEFKKSRRLELNESQLIENFSSEVVFGYGYIIKDFKGFGKPKKARKKKVVDGEEETAKNTKKKSLFDSKGRSLTINMDVAYRDDLSQTYQLETFSAAEIGRGQTVFTISPNVEYQMYKNLAIRFSFDYQNTTSKVTNSPSSLNLKAGGTVKFTFN